MRRTTLGLALSAAVHVGVAVWLGWPSPRRVATAAELPPPSPQEPAPRPPAAELAPPPESLLELAIVELPEEKLPAEPAVPPPPAPRLAVAAVPPPAQRPLTPSEPVAPPEPQLSTRPVGPSGPAVPSAEPVAPSDGATAPPSSTPSRLSMRGALPTRLVVPDLRKIAESGAGAIALTPTAPATSDELVPVAGGRMRSDQNTFVAEVARDGTVKLTDRPNLRVNLALPTPRVIGRGLARWAEDPYAQTRDRERERQRVPSGAVDDDEEQRKHSSTVPIIGGSFDLSDWAMRAAGRDPYWAAKLAFLDRTREARIGMATTHRAELLRNVPTIVRDHLTRAWAEPGLSPAQRRRALFELWDECAESGDDALVEAATSARTAVIGFIRGHLPAGSADAYSEAELAALNRGRQSRQPFAPYQEFSQKAE